MRPALVAGLLVLGLVAVDAAAGEAAPSGPVWRRVLESAAAGGEGDLTGELLWMSWVGDRAHVRTLEVRRTAGALTVHAPAAYTMGFGPGGGLTNHEQGWFVPQSQSVLTEPEDLERDLDALEEKYDVRLRSSARYAGRLCQMLELRRRDDGRLRERLCVDADSGLVLRRETYDSSGQLIRLAVYLRLEERRTGLARTGAVPLQRRAPAGTKPIGERGLEALRTAGWTVPASLPAGYRPVGAYALAPEEGVGWSSALQTVYRDGLYTVSVFQQRGRPDWDALPPGAQLADGFEGRIYEWPGAVPQRYVWQSTGTTFSIVGDAPSDEMRTIAAALPQPDPDGLVGGLLDRLRRGLGRLWSWMSPWA